MDTEEILQIEFNLQKYFFTSEDRHIKALLDQFTCTGWNQLIKFKGPKNLNFTFTVRNHLNTNNAHSFDEQVKEEKKNKNCSNLRFIIKIINIW